MRDFAACFNDHAIKVSDSSCSGSSRGSSSSKSSVIVGSSSSVQTAAVTSVYRTQLSTHKHLLIKVAWSNSVVGPILSLGLNDDGDADNQLLRKPKGTRFYVSDCGSTVGLYWDYSGANFSSTPEPVSNFYVIVIVDAEFGLLLGDLSREYIRRFQEMIHTAEFLLVCRNEQVCLQREVYSYSTKARFSEGGKDHEIAMRCKGDVGWDSAKEPELVVSIDRKRVVEVRRVEWNFRGNQTVFVGGVVVDVMWDVREWWFSTGPKRCGVFMFRKRSVLESKLWFEEEMVMKEKGSSTGFSLLIQAFRTPLLTTQKIHFDAFDNFSN